MAFQQRIPEPVNPPAKFEQRKPQPIGAGGVNSAPQPKPDSKPTDEKVPLPPQPGN